ncbi:MAG: hypothetical protein JNK05_27065 [Myxococcales bacterium]|nr:hypothetical protein [Myxococcales bacterium]
MSARSSGIALVIAALVAVFARPASAQPQVTEPPRSSLPRGERPVDEVAASIEIDGDDGPPVFVYASELRVAVRSILASSGYPGALDATVHESVTGSILNDLLGEKLLERESRRSDDPVPNPSDVLAGVERFFSQLGGNTPADFLRATGAGRATVEAAVRRRLAVSFYLRAHQSRLLEPSDAEVRAAFDSGRFAPYRSEATRFAQVRDEIRERLAAAAMPRAVRSIVRAMGGRVRIRRWPLRL